MRSQFEKRIAKILHSKGVVYEYESYEFDYEEPLRKNRARCGDCSGTNLVRLGVYTPDFWLPEDRFVMLFMRDNRIHRNSKTHYSDWCMERDIDFAIGEPKEDWL
jgi:hypothetical protein